MATWPGVPILGFELCGFGRTKRSLPRAEPHAAIHDKLQEIHQPLGARVGGEADHVRAAAVDEAAG